MTAGAAGWTPRRASAARTTVVVLQVIAMAVVAAVPVSSAWWLLTSSDGASPTAILTQVLVIAMAFGVLALGITGLRTWLAGGPATRLYGFDALPILFIVASAGPAILQDLVGLAIAAVFAIPGLVTYLATSGR